MAKDGKGKAKQAGGKAAQAPPRALTSEIIPVLALEAVPETGAKVLALDDGTYADFMKIATKDYTFASDDERGQDSLQFDRLFRTYPGDLKIVSLYFPVDVSKQRRHFERLLEAAESPTHRALLSTELDKLGWVNANRKEKEYFLFFFFDKKEKHKERLTGVAASLSRGARPLVSYVPEEKKMEILRTLCNKTSAV